jgi:hypothetical protein
VRHVIKEPDGITVAREEVQAIYRAQVPVETYEDADRFWVHFFPGGRARIVVSPFGPEGERHPIRQDDSQASKKSTIGEVTQSFYTAKEMAEMDAKIARDRKKYGDWR